MGCRSDYMEPNRQERESKEAAQLLRYIYVTQGKQVPTGVETAATKYYGNTSQDVVGALCDYLRAMDEATRDSIVYGDIKSPICRQLAAWWERHLKDDLEREHLEKRKREATATRRRGNNG